MLLHNAKEVKGKSITFNVQKSKMVLQQRRMRHQTMIRSCLSLQTWSRECLKGIVDTMGRSSSDLETREIL